MRSLPNWYSGSHMTGMAMWSDLVGQFSALKYVLVVQRGACGR